MYFSDQIQNLDQAEPVLVQHNKGENHEHVFDSLENGRTYYVKMAVVDQSNQTSPFTEVLSIQPEPVFSLIHFSHDRGGCHSNQASLILLVILLLLLFKPRQSFLLVLICFGSLKAASFSLGLGFKRMNESNLQNMIDVHPGLMAMSQWGKNLKLSIKLGYFNKSGRLHGLLSLTPSHDVLELTQVPISLGFLICPFEKLGTIISPSFGLSYQSAFYILREPTIKNTGIKQGLMLDGAIRIYFLNSKNPESIMLDIQRAFLDFTYQYSHQLSAGADLSNQTYGLNVGATF